MECDRSQRRTTNNTTHRAGAYVWVRRQHERSEQSTFLPFVRRWRDPRRETLTDTFTNTCASGSAFCFLIRSFPSSRFVSCFFFLFFCALFLLYCIVVYSPHMRIQCALASHTHTHACVRCMHGSCRIKTIQKKNVCKHIRSSPKQKSHNLYMLTSTTMTTAATAATRERKNSKTKYEKEEKKKKKERITYSAHSYTTYSF